MSSYMVISHVSESIKNVLWQAIDNDPQVNQFIQTENNIVFTNPTQTIQAGQNRLSIWLHHITENEFVKNQPPQRANGHNQLQPAPLALNLYYLITPFAPNSQEPTAEHMLLGKVMQVLHDNAILFVHEDTPEEEVAEELRIVLCRMTLEELTRVWEALREPYRLSICYQVRVTRIESQRVADRAPVIERLAGYNDEPDTLRSDTL